MKMCKVHGFEHEFNLTQLCLTGKEASFIHAPSHNTRLLDRQLATLKKAGAHGVMLDVW